MFNTLAHSLLSISLFVFHSLPGFVCVLVFRPLISIYLSVLCISKEEEEEEQLERKNRFRLFRLLAIFIFCVNCFFINAFDFVDFRFNIDRFDARTHSCIPKHIRTQHNHFYLFNSIFNTDFSVTRLFLQLEYTLYL